MCDNKVIRLRENLWQIQSMLSILSRATPHGINIGKRILIFIKIFNRILKKPTSRELTSKELTSREPTSREPNSRELTSMEPTSRELTSREPTSREPN